jgi:hypothetical protein
MSALGVPGGAARWLVPPPGDLGGRLWGPGWQPWPAVDSTVAAPAAPAAVALTAVAGGAGSWSGWCAAAGRWCLGGMVGHGLCAIVRLRYRDGALGGSRVVAPRQRHGDEVDGANRFHCSATTMWVKTLSS